MQTLSKLRYPYSQIANYGKRPRIEISEYTLKLAKALKSQGYISSFESFLGYIRINMKKKPG